ncbi:MAG: TIGR03013 family PEP-CTERM/XrtA system glycosyltransferase [Alphaproteobacteria bacterium]|nr:TIGR03013 family PEP-CTERM/XrtA system glycosyltransferase [Alphaproteobacteria bacterium]MDX5368781.1 TIGR03013 family PEP-CTERM/XrtA system glycosyltransferase [Alphaproteobacteria bacterium]MDX5463517.1 TIGR03013 family PEP-CTERM/XrtA system glycosyltransferase [Alphaproteobacteria bacterium]
MLNLFGHYVRANTVLLGIAEFLFLGAAFYALAYLLLGNAFGADGQYLVLNRVLVPTCVLMLTMFSLGLYEPRARHDLRVFLIRLAASCAVGGIVLFGFFWWFLGTGGRGSALTGLAASGVAFVVVLLLWFAFNAITRSEAFRTRVIVLGTGDRAGEVASLAAQPGSSLSVASMLSATDIKDAETGEERNLLDLCRRTGATEIVVALQERRGVLPVSELLACRMHGINVTDYSTFCERESGKVDLDNVYPSWLVFSDGFRNTQRTFLWKRLFDGIVSLSILTLCLPILIGTYAAVRLDSKGPGFYRQRRVGLDGKVFEVYKFRSMRTDAEKAGAQWARQNDDRVTRVGRFIRRTRIDELPQLINVLSGDMSFVGPRPERPEFVAELSQEIPYYQDRHRVKPGITGWAQINYPYGASVEDTKEKLKYDLYYMKNCTLFLDFLILLKTIRVVLWPEGVR